MKEAEYALYKDGIYIGNYTVRKLQEKIGIVPKTLYGYATHGLVYKRHYTFKRKYTGLSSLNNMTNEELCKEWDRVRKLLNPQAKLEGS